MAFKMKGPSLLKMVAKEKNILEKQKLYGTVVTIPKKKTKPLPVSTDVKLKKSPAKVDLTKKPVGPRATPKPFDREKFEEETRVAQGMENVRAELFSDKSTHDMVKKNLKKRK